MAVNTKNVITKDDIIVKGELTNNLNNKPPKKSSFFKKFFSLFIPSALQNLAIVIILFVNNIFLAQLSSEGYILKDAVGLANPIINFVLFIVLAWSGGLSIMMGQYYGSKEHNKNQQLVVFGFMVSFILLTPFIIISLIIPNQLISLMSHGESAEHTFKYASAYLRLMVISFIPFVFVEILSTGFQTTNKAVIPLYSVIVNVVINLIFVPVSVLLTKNNPLLSIVLVGVIDIIAKCLQAVFLFLYIIIKKYEPIFFFKKIKLEKDVMKTCLKYAWSSFLNDILFSTFLLFQSAALFNYSSNVKQNNWIANNNKPFGEITTATTNLNILLEFTNVIWPGMSAATAVLVGNALGEGNIKEAKDNSKKCLFCSFMISLVIILTLFSISWFINGLLNPVPENATQEVIDKVTWINQLAKYMEWALLPIILSQGIFSVVIFSIRTGGSKIIVVCDALIMGISTFIMFMLTIFHKMEFLNPVVYVFVLQVDQIVRMIVSLFLYKYYNWAKNLTNSKEHHINPVEAQHSLESLI